MPNTRKKVVAIIQARMGSTRLPGKALLTVSGRTLIEWIHYRLSFCKEIDQVVFSTSSGVDCDPLAALAEKIGLPVFRGSEVDLVSRIYETAKQFNADAIVRITGDCPLVDPAIVDKLVQTYRQAEEVEYVCNVLPPTFPDGLDVEVMSFAVLERLNREVTDPLYREWITTTIMENPDKFAIVNVANEQDDQSDFRLTVDYQEDLDLVAKIFEALHRDGEVFTWPDILKLYQTHPELPAINEKWIDTTMVQGIRSKAWSELKNSIQ